MRLEGARRVRSSDVGAHSTLPKIRPGVMVDSSRVRSSMPPPAILRVYRDKSTTSFTTPASSRGAPKATRGFGQSSPRLPPGRLPALPSRRSRPGEIVDLWRRPASPSLTPPKSTRGKCRFIAIRPPPPPDAAEADQGKVSIYRDPASAAPRPRKPTRGNSRSFAKAGVAAVDLSRISR